MTINLSEYTIRLANPAQEEEYWRACFVPWNRGKDWETFKKDQAKGRTGGDWTLDGGFRCWVLVKRDDLEGPVYSGCETFRRKCLLREPGLKEVKEKYAYAIASVITPVQHHRRGFATHFLRLLHYQLGDPSALPPFPELEWGAPPSPLSTADRARLPYGIASVLFSDVGSTFYERATIGTDRPGWIVNDANCQQLTWKLSPTRSKGDRQGRGAWEWIYVRDLSSIGRQLSAAQHQSLTTGYTDSVAPIWAYDPASPGTLCYVPTLAISERNQGPQFNLGSQPCGIRLPATRPGQDDAIVLFVGPQASLGNALLVTYIHNLDGEQLPILLEALDEAGTEAGVEEGYVWGLSAKSELGKAWLGPNGRPAACGKRAEIKGHLLGLAWYGSLEGRGNLVDTQMWTWC